MLHPNVEGGLPGRKASLNSGEREMEVCLSDEESRVQEEEKNGISGKST